MFDIEGQRAGVAQLSSDKADASSDAGSANTNANASSGTNADEDDDDSSARSLAGWSRCSTKKPVLIFASTSRLTALLFHSVCSGFALVSSCTHLRMMDE